MSLKPILPIGVLLLVIACLFGITAYFIIRNKFNTAEKIAALTRMTVIYVLMLVIGLRPVMLETQYEFATKNLDVLFIVDNTISMWAQDYNGHRERMSGVKADVNLIINELAGSNFGLVTFDDTAHVLSPFTQDMQYIKDLFDTFESPDSYYAKGSDLSIAYQDIDALLRSSARKENRKTIVFFISDGEITNGKELVDYSELAQYIDAGAVLGYGSPEGGKMKEGFGYGYIYDYSTHKDAVSKIDEDNLNKIAEDLGISYLNMNSGNSALDGAVELIKESSKTIIESGSGAEVERDIYYFFAYPLILMVISEIVIFVRRGRL
ncbi:VWA domain-containing protein [Butyrivibrio sp. CB08]|uniref:vWA domain-containing protein n=1 Tax=Butyrivibrio sp. CB08 TaxID=2364879 RepID=UPI000EA8B0BB|nr:VWA domain-containing protein [Butyrivibrio sp. CB08]RKM61332.1 VWA domain-containing protein [Butyrivibrio sp. CB08]